MRKKSVKKTVDPRRWSRQVVDGPKQTPSRAMLRAVGFTDRDFKRPQVGIASINAHDHEVGLPSNGHCVLFDKQCLNKGFAMGPHLALMAPLLLTEVDLRHWCEQPKTRLALARGPHVQARVSMLRALADRFAAQGSLADQLLGIWLAQRRGGDVQPDLPQAA